MRILAVLFGFFLPLAAHAAAMQRFQEFVHGTKSLSADFEQKVYDRAGQLVQQARGSFVFERPGRFRWTYSKPNDQLIVGDGSRVWIYDRDLAQVTVRKMSAALGSTPAALLAGAEDIEKLFMLTDAGEKNGLQWVDAKPRSADSSFERILLGFGPKGIAAMRLVDHFGQTTTLAFSDVARNPKIDPGMFRFQPPPGVDVLGDR